MNKKQLNNLKDFIENRFPEKLAAYTYYNSKHNCNCIVGAMLVDVGGERDELYLDGDYFYAFELSNDSYLKQLHSKFISHFGMEQCEINELQEFNDEFEKFIKDYTNVNSEQRAKAGKSWLIEYISKKEWEIGQNEQTTI